MMLSLMLLFTNGRLIFPDRVADGLSLRTEGGRIVEIGALAPGNGEEVVDLAGDFLAPGFIDLHVHGGAGRDAMEGTADSVSRHLRLPRRRWHDLPFADDGDGADG